MKIVRRHWMRWPLALTDHVLDRMVTRGFSETDLRDMLAAPLMWAPDADDVRWSIVAELDGTRWVVIVEPDPDERVLLVITAWRAPTTPPLRPTRP